MSVPFESIPSRNRQYVYINPWSSCKMINWNFTSLYVHMDMYMCIYHSKNLTGIKLIKCIQRWSWFQNSNDKYGVHSVFVGIALNIFASSNRLWILTYYMRPTNIMDIIKKRFCDFFFYFMYFFLFFIICNRRSMTYRIKEYFSYRF